MAVFYNSKHLGFLKTSPFSLRGGLRGRGLWINNPSAVGTSAGSEQPCTKGLHIHITIKGAHGRRSPFGAMERQEGARGVSRLVFLFNASASEWRSLQMQSFSTEPLCCALTGLAGREKSPAVVIFSLQNGTSSSLWKDFIKGHTMTTAHLASERMPSASLSDTGTCGRRGEGRRWLNHCVNNC